MKEERKKDPPVVALGFNTTLIHLNYNRGATSINPVIIGQLGIWQVKAPPYSRRDPSGTSARSTSITLH